MINQYQHLRGCSFGFTKWRANSLDRSKSKPPKDSRITSDDVYHFKALCCLIHGQGKVVSRQVKHSGLPPPSQQVGLPVPHATQSKELPRSFPFWGNQEAHLVLCDQLLQHVMNLVARSRPHHLGGAMGIHKRIIW